MASDRRPSVNGKDTRLILEYSGNAEVKKS